MVLLAAAAGALAGCEVAREGDPSYDLAQRCVSVRTPDGSAALAVQPDGVYRFVPGEGDPFFLKPAALGEFLLYAKDRRFLGVAGGALAALEEPSDDAVFGIRDVELSLAGVRTARRHSLLASDDRRVTVQGDGVALRPGAEALDADRAALELRERSPESCTAFPEASLDAIVDPAFYEPRDPRDPIVGWADLHAHLGFPRALAGLALAGESFHRFGVEHALGSCSLQHGPDGSWDFLGQQGGAGGPHDTEGWPTFAEWPTRGSFTHNQGYYRWIERAYLSGLRIVVNLATGNPSLCQALAAVRPREAKGDCSPASTVELQTRYMYEMQDYVDAQAGGPGQGWFRIVTSPAEARAVIADNKLAVVLGVEYGTLFDCRIGEEEKCTLKYVDEELAKLHALGVRSVYPVHRFENLFGGTRMAGGDGGAWMNLANKLVTGEIDHITDIARPGKLLFREFGGHYWEAATCPDGVNGVSSLRDMGDFVENTFPDLGPPIQGLLEQLFLDKLGPYPDYASFGPDARICNPRGLTPHGRFLLRRLMERGMIIEIDHLSWDSLTGALDEVEAAGYSGVVSSHSWLENNEEVKRRVFALGGLMVPFNGNPAAIAREIEQRAALMAPHPYVIGVGTGSDVMGVAGQAGADSDIVIDYPFTSYDGLVQFTRPVIGHRSLDYQREGIVHYGLFAEWAEGVRKADERDGRDSLPILMRSAEAYVQMWERAEAWADAAGDG